MAAEHMKRCSTSYVIREIKRTVRDHHTALRVAGIQTPIAPNAGEAVEQQELSFVADGDAKWYRQFGRKILTKLNILGI